MKQAKQIRSEATANKATGMISERVAKTSNRQNAETDHGVERLLEHTRNMYKDRAEETLMLVKGRNQTDFNILRQTGPKFVAANASGKSNKMFMDAAPAPRRTAKPRDLSDNAGQSIPLHIRKAMIANEVPVSEKRNPEDASLLVQNASQRKLNSDGQVLIKASPPVGGQVEMRAKTAPVVVKKTMVAHGVPSNPMAESRRRRALENRIRELSYEAK